MHSHSQGLKKKIFMLKTDALGLLGTLINRDNVGVSITGEMAFDCAFGLWLRPSLEWQKGNVDCKTKKLSMGLRCYFWEYDYSAVHGGVFVSGSHSDLRIDKIITKTSDIEYSRSEIIAGITAGYQFFQSSFVIDPCIMIGREAYVRSSRSGKTGVMDIQIVLNAGYMF
jgi:hypothetical protein